jgi:hypothetical protein
MSIDPGMTVPTLPASGPRGAPFSDPRLNGPMVTAGSVAVPLIREVTRLHLAEGDRLLIHADGALGLGPGGAEQLAQQVAASLRLGELPFDVPVTVISPGLRVEVLAGR